MDSFYIGAYWGPRVQSIEEVTAAALNLFRRLAEADTLFSDWYQLGRSSKEAKEHVFVPGEDSVRQLLLRGQNRRDADRRPIGELGFSLSVWNGRVGPGAANLSILMGAASERVSNRCVVSIQQGPSSSLDISTVPKLKRVMSVLVETLNPNRAVVSSSSVDEALEEAGVHTKVGWLTYLSDDTLPEPSVKAAYQIAMLGETGWLVALPSRDVIDESPEEVSRVVGFGGLVQSSDSNTARSALDHEEKF